MPDPRRFGLLFFLLFALFVPACGSHADLGDDDDDGDDDTPAHHQGNGSSGKNGRAGAPSTGGDPSNGGAPNNSEGAYPDKGDFVFEFDPGGDYEGAADWAEANLSPQEEALNSVFKLSEDIPVVHTLCGQENAFWNGEALILCYELLDLVYAQFLNAGWELTDEEVEGLTASTWLFVMYHELGHGLIDTYALPVPGNEEDAVDSFSTVILVAAEVPDAVVGAALFWKLIGDQSQTLDFADEHSFHLQRFYNLLCWVYGSDPTNFGYLVDTFPDLGPRIAGGRCEAEFEQQYNSWDRLLTPYAQ